METDPEITNFYNECERGSKPELKLIGMDGNAFMLLGLAKRCYQANKGYFESKSITWDKIKEEAMSGDYNNLLCVLNDYFDVN